MNNTAFEIIQGLLSAIFSSIGIIKTYPAEMVKGMIPWATKVPLLLIRLIGIGELVCGIGLILPMIMHTTPVIARMAALGLVFIMGFEIFNHLRSKENKVVGIDLLLLILLLLVVYGRFLK
jgi:uncharacterized membrane protein